MKKLFTLLTLLLCLCSGAWADPTTTSLCPTSDLNPSQGIITDFSSSDANIDGKIYVGRAGGSTNIYNASGASKANSIVFKLTNRAKVYLTLYNNNGNNKSITANYLSINENDYQAIKLAYAESSSTRLSTTIAAWSSSEDETKKNIYDYLKEKYSNFKSANGDTEKVLLGVTVTEGISAKYGTEGNQSITISSNKGDSKYFVFGDNTTYTSTTNALAADAAVLDAGCYILEISSGQDKVGITAITTESIAPATPTLTGAWKISSDDVTGQTANVVQGSSPAPTMPTFTVGATSGSPTAADNYSVAYELVEGSTEGIFTFTDGVPTAISTSTSGKATVRATLTTKDATKFLAPTTNTFDYTVKVSAASAPTAIEITGNSSAVRGADAITLTADVTGGNPTPTIEWFKCDDALKTHSVSQGEASTANTTFDVATTTVGTYYFYAVASNSQGNVSSDVKTITIVPKAPTITASATFTTDSKSVTIAKAEGETEAATIQYKIGNGEWTAYSEALSITATSTVTAKVVQGGLESAEVSATYTKFTPSEITEVNTITTWDWTNWNQTLELKDDGTTSPSSTDDYTFNDIATINGSITVPNTFNGAAMKFKGQFPVRANKSQAGYWTIKPSVNGTITVTFSDTGSSIQTGYTAETQPKRYLNVNGTNTEYYTKRTGSSSDKKTVTVPVSAGEVVITAMDEAGEVWQAIVVEKIIFTPTQTVSVGAKGYSTYCNADYALDFTGKSIKAYTISSTDGSALTLTQKDKVAKGEPVLLYSATNSDSQTIPVIVESEATADATNKLKAGDGVRHTWVENTAEHYVLITSGDYTPGFYRANNSMAAVGKAYLDLTGLSTSARSFSLDLGNGETTSINTLDSRLSTLDQNAPRYNLAGQKVSDSYKGIVIVNGKKVVRK